MKRKVEFDFSDLRGRIIGKFGTCAKFAEAMGFGPTWVSDRLNNKRPWDSNEIIKACEPDILDIDAPNIHRYFFKPKVR